MSMMFRYIDEMDDFRQIWKNRSYNRTFFAFNIAYICDRDCQKGQHNY